MTTRRILLSVLASVLAAGCSSTLVVLVPDPDGKVGEVSVTTDAGERVLSQAGQSTEARSARRVPDEPVILAPDDIRDAFGAALDNEPMPPERHLLYFYFDTAKLKPESQSHLAAVFGAIQQREYCDVSVIGHTDRVGRVAYNEELSWRRAEAVTQDLVELGVRRNCIAVRYYGESDPLIPTPDGVGDARNRRVEVEIK
jgi:outer membrane protein OmpA-like peptidoglycan-associated protein